MLVSKKVDDIAGRVHQHTVGMNLTCVVCGGVTHIRETDKEKIENPVIFHSQNMLYKPCKECGGNVYDVDTFVSVTLNDSPEEKSSDAAKNDTTAKNKAPTKPDLTDKNATTIPSEQKNCGEKHLGVDTEGLNHVVDMSKAGIEINNA